MHDLYSDVALQRRTSDPAPYPHISIMFGCLACCFAFGVTFVSLGWGVPGI